MFPSYYEDDGCWRERFVQDDASPAPAVAAFASDDPLPTAALGKPPPKGPVRESDRRCQQGTGSN